MGTTQPSRSKAISSKSPRVFATPDADFDCAHTSKFNNTWRYQKASRYLETNVFKAPSNPSQQQQIKNKNNKMSILSNHKMT